MRRTPQWTRARSFQKATVASQKDSSELAAELEIPIDRVLELQRTIEDPVSLEGPVGDGESNFADLVEDQNARQPEAAVTRHQRHQELRAALEELGERTRLVLEARFGLNDREPATLEQVGAEIGVTRERVRQIETRALRELETKNPGLRDFLRGVE